MQFRRRSSASLHRVALVSAARVYVHSPSLAKSSASASPGPDAQQARSAQQWASTGAEPQKLSPPPGPPPVREAPRGLGPARACSGLLGAAPSRLQPCSRGRRRGRAPRAMPRGLGKGGGGIASQQRIFAILNDACAAPSRLGSTRIPVSD